MMFAAFALISHSTRQHEAPRQRIMGGWHSALGGDAIGDFATDVGIGLPVAGFGSLDAASADDQRCRGQAGREVGNQLSCRDHPDYRAGAHWPTIHAVGSDGGSRQREIMLPRIRRAVCQGALRLAEAAGECAVAGGEPHRRDRMGGGAAQIWPRGCIVRGAGVGDDGADPEVIPGGQRLTHRCVLGWAGGMYMIRAMPSPPSGEARRSGCRADSGV